MIHNEEQIATIIEECFSRRRPRACYTCPASPRNGGPCCFGDIDVYDENDAACRECVHHDDCRKRVFDKANALSRDNTSTNRLVQIGGQRKAVPSRSSRFVSSPNRESLITKAEPAQMQRKNFMDLRDESPARHFLAVCLWGAFEGLFVMAAEFMRTNRPNNRRD